MANRKFPGVNTTITAKTRTMEVVSENPRVPVLFAPIVANQGPYEVTKVRSIEEFEAIYGELDYYKQGQDVLNLYQWLGGRIPYNGYAWVKRIEHAFVNEDDVSYDEDLTKFATAGATFTIAFNEQNEVVDPEEVGVGGVSFELKFSAVDASPVFEKYSAVITQQRETRTRQWLPIISVAILNDKGLIVSEITNVDKENYKEKFDTLDYFNVELIGAWIEAGQSLFEGKRRGTIPFTINNIDGVYSGLYEGLTIDQIFETMDVYYRSQARTELEDMLTYPISVILDGNYPIYLKQSIIDFIEDVRDDVHFMLSRAEYATINEDNEVIIDPRLRLQEIDKDNFVNEILEYDLPEKGNVAVFAWDPLSVRDPIKDEYVTVSSIYELATKIPENDFKYGIWTNFVGTRRGVVNEEVIYTNTPFDKTKYYEERTNYIEKTNRDQVFMLQRTTGKRDTAYEQLHASRLTQYLRKEITWIGRKYLFEANDIDSTTYSDVKSEIKDFLNQFAKIAIDMTRPYSLEIYKTGRNSFQIALTNLYYKDVVEFVDLLIQLD